MPSTSNPKIISVIAAVAGVLVVAVTAATILIFNKPKTELESLGESIVTTTSATSTAVSSVASSQASTTVSTTSTTATSAPTTVSTTSTNTKRNYFVYFPTSDGNESIYVGKVFALNRQTERTDVLTFLIEQLIVGPNQKEALTYWGPVADMLTGSSNCNGKDFQVKGIANGIATIQFCKDIRGVGTVRDAYFLTSITKTGLQFSNVQKVQILDKNGNCALDESGENLCLQRGYNVDVSKL
jgi:hypothetical protein